MIKTSVKRPFLVFVGVIMVLVLGAVAFVKMKTDLLPSINMPYAAVITTYPGAAPEKVESDVTDPLENALGTITGVENVTSSSAENYSMITLEFAEGTDMDSSMSKISQHLEQLTLPDNAGKPIVMEISSDMMATMYVGVTKDNMDILELTDFVENSVVPELKRKGGVASVSTTGAVKQYVEIRLDEEKIDKINARILSKVDRSLADAQEKITDGKQKISDGKSKLAKSEDTLKEQQKEKSKELAKFSAQLNKAIATKTAYESQVSSIKAQISALKAEKSQYQKAYTTLNQTIQGIKAAAPDNPMLPSDLKEAVEDESKYQVLIAALQAAGQEDAAKQLSKDTMKTVLNGVEKRIPQINTELQNDKTKLLAAKAVLKQINAAVTKAEKNYEKVEQGKITAAAAFGTANAQISAAKDALSSSEKELEEAQKNFDDSKEAAKKNANLDALLSMDTLAQMLSAQNFDMPAGYISEDQTQYLLKVGENYSSLEELKDQVLTKIDGVGDVKLSDVADITMLDDSAENYAKVNGKDAVVLAVTKSSTAYTSEVSDNCNEAMKELKQRYKGLHFLTVMDQGDYIDLIVHSVLQNLLLGALLAIIILWIFLRDIRPTIVIGFSIPLSVLFAVVMMYFSDITFNVISLSGLALGIGMLVDNSVVAIENIYRLRGQGVPAARAAVQGAKQIAGAIVASTLTTICVFLPILFTDGLTRELMMDMCLTIAYSLIASLIVALSVVPAMSATLLRNNKSKEHRIFDKFVAWYRRVLTFCLRKKAVPILAALILLVFSIWQIVRMGIVIIPEMGSEQMSVNITMPQDTDNDEDAELADEILDELGTIKGVKEVGAMASKGSLALMGISGTDSDEIKSIQYYVILDSDYGHKTKQLKKKMEKLLAQKTLEDYSILESNMDMSSMLSSGLQIDIMGNDTDKLLSISEDVMDMVKKAGGFEEIENGQEDGDRQVNIIVDKNKAARLGLTVAQVYQKLAGEVTTDKTATTLEVADKSYEVRIVDERDPVDVDNILNVEFETTTKDDDGKEVTKTHKLKEFAKQKESTSLATVRHDNQTRYISVSAKAKDGYNVTLQSRKLQKMLDKYDCPEGYSVKMAGESESTNQIVKNMALMLLLGFIFIYLVMVAQFQSLLSPFIVIFTVPLAFTGGLLGLLVSGQQLSLMSMMGFLILMGVVVNNGIVFVDYTNQLRLSGMERREALLQAGADRMRPILMTALTTILGMAAMIFGKDVGSDMGRGMAIVVVGGLLYATIMTLVIVPVLYDIMFKKKVTTIDIGEDD